jgi:hypothetical protein
LDDRMIREEMLRQARQRRWLDVALGVIAAIGVSGIGQIIQTGYDVRSYGALAITAAIVGLAVLVGMLVRTVNAPPTDERRRQKAEKQLAKHERRADRADARATVPEQRTARDPVAPR